MNDKKTNLVIKQAQRLQQEGRAHLVNIESFNKHVNSQPPKEAIKTNKFQGNARYIPIGFIENWLDELYFCIWSTENMTHSVIANEICVKLELKVFHPIAKVWITRTGAGAALIRQSAGADITDISAKIKNAMVQDFSHAKAEAFKNAAKSLGKRFGRDLNRDFTNSYNTHLSNHINANKYSVEEIKEKLKTITELDFYDYFESNPFFHSDPNARTLFEEKQRDFNDETF